MSETTEKPKVEKTPKVVKTSYNIVVDRIMTYYPNATEIVTNNKDVISKWENLNGIKLLTNFEKKRGLVHVSVTNIVEVVGGNIISCDMNGDIKKNGDGHVYANGTKYKYNLHELYNMYLDEYVYNFPISVVAKDINKYKALPSDKKSPESSFAFAFQGMLVTKKGEKGESGSSISATKQHITTDIKSINQIRSRIDTTAYLVNDNNQATKSGGSSIGNLKDVENSDHDYFTVTNNFNIMNIGKALEYLYDDTNDTIIYKYISDEALKEVVYIMMQAINHVNLGYDNLFSKKPDITPNLLYGNTIYSNNISNTFTKLNSFDILNPDKYDIIHNAINSSDVKVVIYLNKYIYENGKYMPKFAKNTKHLPEYIEFVENLCYILNNVNPDKIVVTDDINTYLEINKKMLFEYDLANL